MLGTLSPVGLARKRSHAPHVVSIVEETLTACRAALGDATFEALVRGADATSIAHLAAEALDEAPARGSRLPAALERRRGHHAGRCSPQPSPACSTVSL